MAHPCPFLIGTDQCWSGPLDQWTHEGYIASLNCHDFLKFAPIALYYTIIQFQQNHTVT
ncbi:hypothetical protein Hanom_Chr09g00851081 [Helianthus anomalus]